MSAVDPAVLAYRADQNQKAIDRLTVWRTETDKTLTSTSEQVRELRSDIGELSKQVASVKKLLVTLLVTITGSTVVLALSLLAATGRIAG